MYSHSNCIGEHGVISKVKFPINMGRKLLKSFANREWEILKIKSSFGKQFLLDFEWNSVKQDSSVLCIESE